MKGVIFSETLRQHWISALWWGVGIGLMALLQVIFVQDMDAVRQIADLLETMPAFLIQGLIGTNDIEYLASGEGYLATSFYSIALLMYAFYAVTAGMNVSANEEDKGILNLLMSTPITRTQLVIERFLSFLILSVFVVIISTLFIWAGLLITPALQVESGRIIEGSLNILPSTWAILAFTLFIGALMRRRNLAFTLACIFVVAGYFLDFIGRGASESILNQLRVLSYYSYYDGTGVLQYGLNFGNISVLLVFTALFLGLGVFLFKRRDIGL